MIKKGNLYKAEDGHLIVRIEDNFIMGDAIDLGSADNIDNYEEREFTSEEIENFMASVNIENNFNGDNESQSNDNTDDENK